MLLELVILGRVESKTGKGGRGQIMECLEYQAMPSHSGLLLFCLGSEGFGLCFKSELSYRKTNLADIYMYLYLIKETMVYQSGCSQETETIQYFKQEKLSIKKLLNYDRGVTTKM